jgi:hypothetical protein
MKLYLLPLLALIFFACTKDLPEKFPDGQGDGILEISFVENADIEVAGTKIVQQKPGMTLQAHAEKPKVFISQYKGPEALQYMFKDLTITSNVDEFQTVRFELDQKGVTAFKVVPDKTELSSLESQIAKTSTEGLRVPLFRFDAEYGVKVRSRNDLGEETHILRFEPTEFASATHVKISNLAASRKLVQVDLDENVFSVSKLDKSLFTLEQIRGYLGIPLREGPVFGSKVYYSVLKGSKLSFYLITQYANLDQERQRIIDQQDAGSLVSNELMRCPADIKSTAFSAKVDNMAIPNENCIAVLAYEANVDLVIAERAEAQELADGSTILDADILFKPVSEQDLRDTGFFVRIVPGTIPANRIDSNHLPLDPVRSLPVAEIKDKEFLFRRTLVDVPNEFKYSMIGSAGRLEIVKFVILKDAIQIVRAEPLNDRGNTTGADLEVLMSIPVLKYVRPKWYDEYGNRLSVPDYEATSFTHPDAIADLNWAHNTIPNVASALDYYGLEQCFSSSSNKRVLDVRQALKEGILGLTVSTTYSASTGIDCAGLYTAGYFDATQAIFTFEERISFKVYNREHEKPLLDVPYKAQKLLGFGLFTFTKNTPNEHGNTGRDGSEIPLPAVYDIQNGKSITYVLAGLPEDKKKRAALIQATREVIDEWNVAFRKALKGSALERADDVVKLLIEGVDTDAGELGDLDRNHIFLVNKTSDYPVLGLGGAHSNPRSGVVEAASSFIYTGNMWSNLEYIKRAAAARNAYEEIMSILIPPQNVATPDTTEASSGEVSGGSTGEAATVHEHEELEHAAHHDTFEHILEDWQSFDGIEALKAEQIRNLSVEGKALYETLQAVSKKGSPKHSAHVAAMFSSKLAGKVDGELAYDLHSEAASHEIFDSIKQKMHNNHFCVHDVTEMQIGTAAEALIEAGEMTDIELFVRLYKPTLAHELGHNFGLRHNFKGSYDKASFKFHADEESGRRYSSIMDYQSDDHLHYDGLGPHDVASIRVAYTGLMELHPEIIKQLPTNELGQKILPLSTGESIVLADNKHINISDYKRILGLDSWLYLKSADLQKLPLKQYLFCSDEDKFEDPTCNAFDKGTTPSEIVNETIHDYLSSYSITNFAGDRLEFSYWNNGRYIGRIFDKFLLMRQFLEEALYRAITNGPEVQEMINAAAQAMFFFNNVIGTPDTSGLMQENERFQLVDSEQGSFPIETKWIQNVGFGDGTDRIAIRGIEWDKVIATIMLTQRRWGWPKYEAISLRISFPEFEKLVFSQYLPDVSQHPTMSTLHNVMMDDIAPTATNPVTGQRFSLGWNYQAKTTETMRIYAVLGAIANLDVDGLEASSNMSSHFRVFSDQVKPEGLTSVVKPGASIDSVTSLKYFTDQSALVSYKLVEHINAISLLESRKEELAPLFKKWSVLAKAEMEKDGFIGRIGISLFVDENKDEGELPEEPAVELSEIEQVELKINEILARMPAAVVLKDMEIIGSNLRALMTMADGLLALSEQIGQPGGPADQRAFQMTLEKYKTLGKRLAKNAPSLGFAMENVDFEALGNPILGQIMAPGTLKTQKGMMFVNIDALNRYFYMLHDEYK